MTKVFEGPGGGLERVRKTFRAKLSCGLTVTFKMHRQPNGTWKPFSLGNAKRGREHVPLAFVPFCASNAVINPIEFQSAVECEIYLRGL